MYCPNSLCKSDGWIVIASRFFEDIIVHDEFSANDIPFMLTELLNEAEDNEVRFWNGMKEYQLTSIYATLGDMPNLPDHDDIMNASKFNPRPWDAVESMIQSERQNEVLFNKQKLAMQIFAYSIDKYCGVSRGDTDLTLTKGVIAHGASGTGKSFVGQRSVLYSLSQGLKPYLLH